MLSLLRRHIGLIKMFVGVGFFLQALDSAIALNRWFFDGYVINLVEMVVGFTVFTLLLSQNKRQMLGFALLATAIYYICDYEIGGLSMNYLTPFDPLLGMEPTLKNGSLLYRRAMAYLFSILAASVLALSRWKAETKKRRDTTSETIK